jgi:hypothetical protein
MGKQNNKVGNLAVSDGVLKMEFPEFEKYWKANHEKDAKITSKAAAKKLGIKVPAKTEGGE